jgi:hypothetical protein
MCGRPQLWLATCYKIGTRATDSIFDDIREESREENTDEKAEERDMRLVIARPK